MKRALALLIGMMICASVARGGDMKIKAVMTTGPKDKPTTIFTTDTPKVLALFKTKGAQRAINCAGSGSPKMYGRCGAGPTPRSTKKL